MVARQQLCSEEQLSQLLMLLAAAPDLSLFRDKWERLISIQKNISFSMHVDEQMLVQLAAALSRGLMLLVPLLLLDLPKRALHSIGILKRMLGCGQIRLSQQLGQIDARSHPVHMRQVACSHR
jgi:hypothetical protein